MKIVEVTENKKQYLDLLLLADEQEEMIDRYLDKVRMYVLDDGIKCECVVTDEDEGVLEIKNIATSPKYQGMGYAKALIDFIAKEYREYYTILQVGTGDSPMTIPFYKECRILRKGECVVKVVKNIFICIFPLLVWGVYLYLSPYSYTSYTLNLFDLVLLFLLLPIGYSVYNTFSRTKWEWIMKSLVFITIHAFGCWLNDFVYIDDFLGKHYFGITYRPVDFFVIHLILIDVFILLISYLVKRVFVKNKTNNEL